MIGDSFRLFGSGRTVCRDRVCVVLAWSVRSLNICTSLFRPAPLILTYQLDPKSRAVTVSEGPVMSGNSR